VAIRTYSDHFNVRYHFELQRVLVREIPFDAESHNTGTHTMMSRGLQSLPCTDDCKQGLNVWGSVGVDPDILNLINRWRKTVSFTPLAFYFNEVPRDANELDAGWVCMLWRDFSHVCAETNANYMEVKLLRLIQTDTHSKHIRLESSTRTDIPADVVSVSSF
jgi:hypothetical protein